jgi:hypothetical protein
MREKHVYFYFSVEFFFSIFSRLRRLDARERQEALVEGTCSSHRKKTCVTRFQDGRANNAIGRVRFAWYRPDTTRRKRLQYDAVSRGRGNRLWIVCGAFQSERCFANACWLPRVLFEIRVKEYWQRKRTFKERSTRQTVQRSNERRTKLKNVSVQHDFILNVSKDYR